jgi:membrane protease YdiL (CAAX protease family)
MPLPFVITANAAVGKPWGGHATGILCGLTAGVIFLIGALDLAGAGLLQAGPGGQQIGLDLGVMATSLVAATLASRPVRERIARVLPIDPDSPVHAYGLVLAVILFGSQVSTTVFTDVLASDRQASPVGLADLAASEAPFLILALAGVGLYIRREAAGVAERLGLTRPAWWQIALALAAAGAFFAFIQGADNLMQSLTPQTASQVNSTSQHVFGALAGNPLGIAALALLPGICEEILFRGALQPRIGLLATAVLFASIHTQYGLSLDALGVFVLAIGLGLIRKYTNTTTSCVCHVSYNLLTGIGIAADWTGAAVAVELVLVAASGYAIWRIRQRQTVPVQP